MTGLQKKIAAKILKVGEKRVWIDPKNVKVRQAITRRDIRNFINEGTIKKIKEKKRAKHEKKRQQNIGSRKGSRGARIRKKELWLLSVRPQRKLLKQLKGDKKIEVRTYRQTYKLVKGRAFRSKSHLLTYLKDKKFLKE